jgi:hypothetical protein
MKTRRPRTAKLKRRKEPTAARRPGSSAAADLQTQLDQRTRELAEARNHLAKALEQQTATSEVLRVISSSPGKLEPVFQAMLANATRLCEAKFGLLNLRDGEEFFRNVALYKVPKQLQAVRLNEVIRPHPQSGLARLLRTRQVVYIDDLTATPAYRDGDPVVRSTADLGGARTLVLVPMLKEQELLGTFVIYRTEVRPFTDKQIELVRNFAAQAIIAIENSRLLNDLRESLERQTATSEVLQVISRSPGELQPVAAAMLANATRICEADLGVFHLYDAGAFPVLAMQGATPAFADRHRREPRFRPKPEHPLGRLAATKAVIHIADALTEPPSM